VRSGKAPIGVAVSNRASVVWLDDKALSDNGNINKPMNRVIKAMVYNFFIKTILLNMSIIGGGHKNHNGVLKNDVGSLIRI
jgi:hypothetical protein